MLFLALLQSLLRFSMWSLWFIQSDFSYHMMDVSSVMLMVTRERWPPPETGSFHPKAGDKTSLVNPFPKVS